MKCGLGFGGVIASARVKPDQYIPVVPIDDEGKLWNITLVEAKAWGVDSSRPFLEMAHSFFKSVVKHVVDNSCELSNYL